MGVAPRCLVLCFCLVDALCTNRSMYEYGKGLQQMGLYGSMMHLGWWCNWGCRGAFGMLVGFISQLLMWRLPSGFIQVAPPLHSQGWVSPSHFSQPAKVQCWTVALFLQCAWQRPRRPTGAMSTQGQGVRLCCCLVEMLPLTTVENGHLTNQS